MKFHWQCVFLAWDRFLTLLYSVTYSPGPSGHHRQSETVSPARTQWTMSSRKKMCEGNEQTNEKTCSQMASSQKKNCCASCVCELILLWLCQRQCYIPRPRIVCWNYGIFKYKLTKKTWVAHPVLDLNGFHKTLQLHCTVQCIEINSPSFSSK